ncbi:SDR family oxidoreductase [Pseudokineococcus marinus]|uniref:SDR family NAD(P)-dependent oxidoreductase n=1 Tax=Pseudokineococcus marinus TaxID=351215 RepID=UPI001BB0DAE5|nr:SDR family oxidoreductase [Pseudokineococcus marinus]
MRPYVVDGGTAVVTGAAGGIGEALARALAARGSHLALLDRDAERLEGVASALRAAHPLLGVRTYVVDLADRAATARALDAVRADHPRVTLVVSNAGVALGGLFRHLTLEEFWWVVEVNLRATVQVVSALLPALREQPGSHVVTVASIFGVVAPPGQSAYATSKFAVRGFTEALRAELRPDGVGVTCVMPGGVRTRIAQDARGAASLSAEDVAAGRASFQRLLTMDPADVAEQVLDAVERRRPRLLVGWSAKLPALLERLVPGASTRVLGLLARSSAPGRRLLRGR